MLTDSIYTERYMSTPQLNPHGYETSAVNNMTGFENVKYLLAHGTGDDNGKHMSRFRSDRLTIILSSSLPKFCCPGG